MTQDSENPASDSALAGAVPFFLSGPVGVASAGAMLCVLGASPLKSNWSPVTISLIHLITLGFLTMISMGSYYVIAAKSLGKPLESKWLPRIAYLFFAIGIIGFCLGLARGSSTPVFVAIGSLFPGLGCFLWPAISGLRGTGQDARAQGLRIAIGAFSIAAFLGIWLAHGHGGMKFPGPRGLWIRVHLAVALLGWIGGIGSSAFGYLSGTPDTRIVLQRPAKYGMGIALALLMWEYSGLYSISHANLSWLTTLAVFPIAFVFLISEPWRGLKRLRADPQCIREPLFWRTAFAFAPLSALLGISAIFSEDPRARMVFGWTAIWGWGGLMAHAMWRRLLPLANSSSDLSAQIALPGERTHYTLHLLSLVLGIGATVFGSDVLARVTGISLIALAAAQGASAFRSLRPNPAEV